LILLPNIYWWRRISSNDAHFMWLIEILMFQVLTKGTHHLRNVKDRNQEETRRERATISPAQLIKRKEVSDESPCINLTRMWLKS
jgi:hypothetical protein